MLRTLLLTLGIPAAAAATVIPVAGVTGELEAVGTFSGASALLAIIAFAAHRWLPGRPELSTPTRLSMVAGCWVVVVTVGSAITWVAVLTADNSAGAAALTDPWSATFETASGFSTTGLTMLSDSSTAEPWLQWWRSVLQWLGAIGVVVFAATVAEPSGDHDTLVGSEWGDQPGAHAGQTARRLVSILFGVSVFGIGGQIVTGEPLWRAVNHGMAAAATGGFSITSSSAGDISGAARVVIALTLLLSAISFGTVFDRTTRKGVPIWKRTQIRYGLGATALCTVGALAVSSDVAVQDVVFNSISASTTGGFTAGTSYREIEALAAIAMVSMFIGGAAGSTAGGIKSARLAWLSKAAARWLPGDTDSEDEKTYSWDGDDVGRHDARHRIMGAASIVVTWLLLVAIGAVILAVHNPTLPASDMLFEVFSAGSGVGLSSGVTGSDADAATKVTLTVLMIAGRVEMTAFVVMLAMPIARLRQGLSRT